MVGTPSNEAIRVALEDMGKASLDWTNAYTHLLAAGNLIPSVVLSDAGFGDYSVFRELRSRYKDCPGYVLERLKEGQSACMEIAKILKDGRDTYQREEDENRHAFTNLY